MNVAGHSVSREYRNAIYLLAAISMVFMTLAMAVQPLFLRNILGVSLANAGWVNANVHVLTEALDLALILYLGYLSDRFGRLPIATIGFVVAAVGSLVAPFSHQLGVVLGIGGFAFSYLSRLLLRLRPAAASPTWPPSAQARCP